MTAPNERLFRLEIAHLIAGVWRKPPSCFAAGKTHTATLSDAVPLPKLTLFILL